MEAHGGRLAVEVLRAHGVDTMFTLSGGHLFVLYDGAVQNGELRLVDVRHEQSAVFAAEGWAKVTRRLGCAAITAGPGRDQRRERDDRGVDERLAASSCSRAARRRRRWGSGSLQELDHVPIVAPVTKTAATATSAASIVTEVDAACRAARTPAPRPHVRRHPARRVRSRRRRDARGRSRAAFAATSPTATRSRGSPSWSRAARRPVLVAGGDVYWADAEDAMRAFVEAARVPTFVNGMGRGTLPADHELAFSRARSVALKQADLVLVAGHAARLPARLRALRRRAGRAPVRRRESQIAAHADARGVDRRRPRGDVRGARRQRARRPRARDDWVALLRDDEQAKRAAELPLLEADTAPIKPARIYGELRKRLDRDAIVIGDGGDFVSYAGKFVDSYEPGTFLDPGSVRLPRHGPGLRARRPASRIPTARSCCCSATARSASRSATSRRSCATA